MFLLLAVGGFRKADGYSSGWNPARVYEIIFICQVNHLPPISQAVRRSRSPDLAALHAGGLRLTDGA